MKPDPMTAEMQAPHTPGLLLEVETRIAIAERQGWTNRSVPVLLLRAVAEQLQQRDDLLAALKQARDFYRNAGSPERFAEGFDIDTVEAVIAKAEGQ